MTWASRLRPSRQEARLRRTTARRRHQLTSGQPPMLRRRAFAPTAALLLSCLATPALAQPPQPGPDTPPPAPTAAELREKGRTALAGGDVAGACLLFEQSYQAAAKPGAAGPPADACAIDKDPSTDKCN